MLGAFLQFTAILKQFELLESYSLKISSGGLLSINDTEIIKNLLYSLRNTSYYPLNKLDSDNVIKYINNAILKLTSSLVESDQLDINLNKVSNEISIQNTETINIIEQGSEIEEKNDLDFIENTPTVSTDTYVNSTSTEQINTSASITQTNIDTYISSNADYKTRSGRKINKPKKLGFDN